MVSVAKGSILSFPSMITNDKPHENSSETVHSAAYSVFGVM